MSEKLLLRLSPPHVSARLPQRARLAARTRRA
jgi:hypothetical protein